MKNTTLFSLISFPVFFTPIKGLLMMVIAFVLADTAFAIFKAIKNKESLDSDKAFNIIPKLIGYLGAILLGYLVDVFIFDGKLPMLELQNGISKLIAFVAISIEVKSIDETNIKLGNKPFKTLFKSLVGSMKGIKKDISELKD
jgi:hypothetical protein